MAKREPVFSIVVPTRDRPGELAACLASLAALDFPGEDFEVIVVDDGSLREPADVVGRFSGRMDVSLVTRPPSGPARARNTGASLARGRWLAFTDDDCLVAPGWLTGLARRLSRDDGCAVGGRTLNALPDNPYARASQIVVDYTCRRSRDDSGGPRFFPSNNLALPGRLFWETGGFSETFGRAGGEDRELCLRLREGGTRLVYAPDARVYHQHALDLKKFLRQHMNYGRGAFLFHTRPGPRLKRGPGFEPLSFYPGLVFRPLFLADTPGRVLLVLLLALSQAATLAGYLLQALETPSPRGPGFSD